METLPLPFKLLRIKVLLAHARISRSQNYVTIFKADTGFAAEKYENVESLELYETSKTQVNTKLEERW